MINECISYVHFVILPIVKKKYKKYAKMNEKRVHRKYRKCTFMEFQLVWKRSTKKLSIQILFRGLSLTIFHWKQREHIHARIIFHSKTVLQMQLVRLRILQCMRLNAWNFVTTRFTMSITLRCHTLTLNRYRLDGVSGFLLF